MATALNPAQNQAVKYLNGPCLVLAGAGSGKTRVITRKIAYLITECGYQANKVCALTFTNKAAKEMSERLREIVNPRFLKGLTIGTFHSLGLRFLREEYALCKLKQNFSVLDAGDALAIVQELTASTDKAHIRSVQQKISLWKNALIDPDSAFNSASDNTSAEAAKIYYSYQATLFAYQAVDFDDLIRLPAQILLNDEAARKRWQARTHYLLVDEYQDTNTCQYQLMKALSGSRQMFTVVGDDDQAIYAWRGATAENLQQLNADYPQLKVIKLEQNYRSVQSVLKAANNVISHNPKSFDKKLWSELGAGSPIGVTSMANDLVEAESIALRISADKFRLQASWKDFAVLYRGNHQARVLEQAFRTLRIPYTISGGQSFFDKAEIRDILAWLRLIANEDEDPAFIRAATSPKRGIGQNTLQALGEQAAKSGCSLYTIASGELENILSTAKQRNAVYEFIHLINYFQNRIQPGAVLATTQADIFEQQPSTNSNNIGIDQQTEDSVARLLDDLLQIINYEYYLYDIFDDRQAQNRWSNVQELTQWLKRKADEEDFSIQEIVQYVALITMLDRSDDEEPDAVKLSTIHASKGLEYPHVFLIGVEENLLPHRGNAEDEDDTSEAANIAQMRRIEEERRLMYVAITRARSSLQISWCKKRRRAREEIVCEPSRFIAEMGINLKEEATTTNTNPEQTLSALKNLLSKQD